MSNRLRDPIVTLLLVVTSAFAQGPTLTPAADEHLQYWIRTVGSHPMKLVRKNAARNLGSMGDRAATPALIAALQDPFFGVRAEAARSLGLLTDESAETVLAKAVANDADAQVRRNAREAIEKLKAYREFLKKKEEKRKGDSNLNSKN